ncbi:MAG: DNA polymerase I [Chitinophagales bacterium]|nr:DNA polymerase I [Chitinophagales bacterium]
MSENKKLYLFDSFALIFRAYFAMSKNPLVNSKGQNTSTISGFLSTIHEIIKSYKPTHVGFAFDSPVITDRQAAHEFYKANRQEAPEDIKFAIPYIKHIIKAMNYPLLEVDGYEADDIVGTLAKQAAAQGYSVYMVTSDKDFGQLVEENVFIHKPPYMGKGHEILGVAEICERWEIDEPKKVIDILGLMGDAVDNIPGIPGVGEKTAKKLIQDFGSVESVLENVDQLKGALKEKVEKGVEYARISKQLATIMLDAPVSFHEEDFMLKEPNRELVEQLFAELEFRTLGKRILGDSYQYQTTKSAISTPSADTKGQMNLFGETSEIVFTPPKNFKTIDTTPHNYRLANTEETLRELLNALHQTAKCCFDTETTAIDPNACELVGMSFCFEETSAWYVPVPEDQKEARALVHRFKPFFEHPEIIKIGQNIKYDAVVLKWYGIELQGFLYDTMLAHYCLESDSRHNMNILAETYLNYSPVSIETLIGKKGASQGNMRNVETEKIKEYAAEDADITFQLEKVFTPKLSEEKVEKVFFDVESPLITVLTEMEYNGVKIDTQFLKEFSEELQHDLRLISDDIYQMAGLKFNIDSPRQMGEVLFKHMKIPYTEKNTKGGQMSTNEEVLQKLEAEHPIASKILDYRELAKLKSTYVDALPALINKKTGKVHTTFNQTIASTGRLSSTNPNLQNIPIRTDRGRKTRQAFIASDDDHIILSADYSQIELRIIASMSKDEKMMEAFVQGHDIHAATAANVFGVSLDAVDSNMRRKAKMVNFGIIYGISGFGLAQRLQISRTEANTLIKEYFEKYKGIKKYMDDSIQIAKDTGYATTLLGRRRYLRDINSRNFTIRGFAERNAINMPIQGTAADMIKLAMIDIHKELKKRNLSAKMTLQVHDELLFDVPLSELEEVENLVKNKMQNALPLNVPIIVEAGKGKNWLEAH